MLDDRDLWAFMQANQVQGEIIHLETPTPTVETAAQAMGVQPEQIVKTVLFIINETTPVLAIACGLGRIDPRCLAARYQVNRKKVKLADADTVQRLTGYAAGAVPPFGHLQRFPTLLDACIQAAPMVYAGGGTRSALVRVAPAEIARVTQGEWVRLLQPVV